MYCPLKRPHWHNTGFRGEALSSLCALADVSVLTCTENETVGTFLEYDKNGILTKKSPKARVNHIQFYPARLTQRPWYNNN